MKPIRNITPADPKLSEKPAKFSSIRVGATISWKRDVDGQRFMKISNEEYQELSGGKLSRANQDNLFFYY